MNQPLHVVSIPAEHAAFRPHVRGVCIAAARPPSASTMQNMYADSVALSLHCNMLLIGAEGAVRAWAESCRHPRPAGNLRHFLDKNLENTLQYVVEFALQPYFRLIL